MDNSSSKQIYRILLLFPLLLLFLPAFVLIIGENQYIRFSLIVLPIAMGTVVLLTKNQIFSKLNYLIQKTSFKTCILFWCWIAIASLFSVFLGRYNFSSYSIYGLMQLFFRIILIAIFPILIVPKFFSLKEIIKLFYSLYFIILIFGIAEFIGVVLDIDIINNIIHITSNIRDLEKSIIIEPNSNLARIRSVFMEPGEFGQFLVTFMPITYTLSQVKYRIFKNIYTDYIIKKTTIPLTWICLLLSQSPIYISIGLIVTVILFSSKILYFTKKYFAMILSIFIVTLSVIISFFLAVNVTNSFMVRIIKVLSIFYTFNLDNLISADASLATRICSYVAQVELAIKHPFIGIGFGNNGPLLLSHFLHTSVPLTPEIHNRIMLPGRFMINTNALSTLCFQTGFLGLILYCVVIKESLKTVKKYITNFSGIEYEFLSSIYKSLIIMFIISCVYNISIYHQMLWFFIGLIYSLTFIKEKRIKNDKNKMVF